MSDPWTFRTQCDGELFLTEGGTETEIMYKWGFELPHFAMFSLLENRDAMSAMRGIFRRYLDVVAKHEMSAMLTGLDYRASPDWGALLGYSPEALADANHRSIDFLRDVARDYSGDIRRTLVGGCIGPRGDAYQLNRSITSTEAEDYHAVQLTTLKQADVDFACAMTFNNTAEAIGVTRAAARIGVPLVISLTVDATGRLKSGLTVAEAIETIDARTGAMPAFYMLNCSHPVEFASALADGEWIRRVRGIRPNASKMEKLALCKLGHLEEGDPVELGRLMGDLARRHCHMDVWGGCCGTAEVHLDEIARNVCAVRKEPVNASRVGS
jgi:S-methylmethionine-dependent homocysteine/selenocysteine methylase